MYSYCAYNLEAKGLRIHTCFKYLILLLLAATIDVKMYSQREQINFDAADLSIALLPAQHLIAHHKPYER
jgi:hypothetical protein